jgi:hypothetical protein
MISGRFCMGTEFFYARLPSRALVGKRVFYEVSLKGLAFKDS